MALFENAKSDYYERNKIIISPNISVPRYILSPKSHVIDIEKLRARRISNRSSQERNFMSYIPNALTEVPFVIEDRETWNSEIDRYKYVKNIISEKDRVLFQVDLVIEEASLGIELDSEIHDDKIIQDKIRDEYLMLVHGVKILRYDSRYTSLSDFLAKVNSEVTRRKKPLRLDFRKSSDLIFDSRYGSIINKITDLLKIRYDLIDKSLDGFIITRLDLKTLNLNTDDFLEISNWIKTYWDRDFYYANIDYTIDQVISMAKSGQTLYPTQLQDIFYKWGYQQYF